MDNISFTVTHWVCSPRAGVARDNQIGYGNDFGLVNSQIHRPFNDLVMERNLSILYPVSDKEKAMRKSEIKSAPSEGVEHQSRWPRPSCCCPAPVTRAQNYTNFTMEVGATNLIPNASPGIPVYPWFPDGHITMLPEGNSFQMYWAGSSSYRSIGPTISSQQRNPTTGSALTKGASTNDFDNGGAWLMSVFRQSGNNLIGFYHGEDHNWPGYTNPGNIAWKSIAYCSSTDNGITWTKGGQIITSPTAKPASPTWGGSGDACVVYDAKNARWVVSTKRTGFIPPSPPMRYRFREPGRNTTTGRTRNRGWADCKPRCPGSQNYSGANPSVHFNTHLKKWVMVWHRWNDSGLWLSISDNLLNWQTPINIVSASSPERKWYPTIIGRTDVLASEYANLYYAYWPDRANWQRQFLGVPIRFRLKDIDADGLPDAWEQHHFGSTTITPSRTIRTGTGVTIGNEYLADTEPTNSASCLRIMDVLPLSANQTVFTWQSSEYKRYGIELSTNPFTSWTGIASNIPATPPLNSFTNTSAHPGAFYRIRLEPD